MTKSLRLSRRVLLEGAGAIASGALAGCGGRQSKGEIAIVGPPQLPCGVQSGDVGPTAGVVWSKSDRRSRMVVDWSYRPDLGGARRFEGPIVTSETDFTGKVELSPLPRDSTIHYRVSFIDETSGAISAPTFGRFRVAPTVRRDVFFTWGADTCGQGFGIDKSQGGLLTYGSMLQLMPDFFVNAGDLIYADQPIVAEVKLEGGGVWHNVTNPAVARVAESLEDLRARFAYNLQDEHVRALAAEVPTFVVWDDHETFDNWYPEKTTTNPLYGEKRASVISERGRRALFEYTPMRRQSADARRLYRAQGYGPSLDLFFLDGRSYRGVNGPNFEAEPGPATRLYGQQQLDWLKRNLNESRATWKIIVAGQPIGLVVTDGAFQDGIAQGPGAPQGREHEIAALLSFMKERHIKNVVFLSGDVHYAAALRYDPSRASFKGFNPFWEFVAGPLHAGTFGPAPLDPTFGPEVLFQKVPPHPNAAPSEGYQFFGGVHVHGRTEVLTVTLYDRGGSEIYRVIVPPEA